ncbi:MAG: AI-2E family transporter [Elusimicrobia bacterium]|nr:AI-2E family transporter [Elusimicrobiota bacterium]
MADERRSFPFLTVFIVGTACAYAFYRIHHALTPFVLAAAFAYVLNPILVRLEARGLRRGHLVAGGYLIAAALGAVAYSGLRSVLTDEAEMLQAKAPSYMRAIQKAATTQQVELAKRLPLPQSVTEKALEGAVGGTLEKLQELPSHLFALIPLLAHALLVPFIGFFFLLDGPSGVDSLIQSCPSRLVEQAIHLLSEVDKALGNYVRGLLIVVAVIFTISFAGLVALGVDNALIIAAISGLSSVVPYFGLVMGIVVGGSMAWYQFGTPAAFLKVAALFLGIRGVEETLVQPMIARHSLHMHAMTNLLVLILGGEMFGFLGLVFAVPAAGVLKALINVTWSWYASERGFASVDGDGTEIPYT